jgi:hypothetical protein
MQRALGESRLAEAPDDGVTNGESGPFRGSPRPTAVSRKLLLREKV